ncbi:MAG: hypothetical protein AAF654_00865 [Myxococcota bacterium]
MESIDQLTLSGILFRARADVHPDQESNNFHDSQDQYFTSTEFHRMAGRDAILTRAEYFRELRAETVAPTLKPHLDLVFCPEGCGLKLRNGR